MGNFEIVCMVKDKSHVKSVKDKFDDENIFLVFLSLPVFVSMRNLFLTHISANRRWKKIIWIMNYCRVREDKRRRSHFLFKNFLRSR